MSIRYLVGALFPALFALTACQAGTTGQTELAQVEVALATAEHTATVYVTQPQCPTGTRTITCADLATVAKIKAADNVAYNSVVQARSGKVTTTQAEQDVNALLVLIPH